MRYLSKDGQGSVSQGGSNEQASLSGVETVSRRTWTADKISLVGIERLHRTHLERAKG